MKKIILSLAAVAAMAPFTSCNDFLTEDVRGKENLETYFKSEDEASSFIVGCYYDIAMDDWWQIYNAWLLSDMMTDDLWDGNTSQEDGYMKYTYFMPTATEDGPMSNMWGARYKGIANCNLGLEKIPSAPLKAADRDKYIAELKFLRGFFYFDLVRNFGGVPMLLTYGSDGNGIPRSTQEECYAQIEKDLSEAAAVLPARKDQPAAETGRATRGAALGLLGKAQLYQGKWEEAKKTLGTIITEGGYELLPNFGDVWSVAYNNSVESLFEVQTMYNGDLYPTGGSLTTITGCRNGIGDGWAWGTPTSDLENAYIAAGDTERLRWTIIKTGCTEIAGEDQFYKFVANNSSVKDQMPAYKQAFGWTDEVYQKGYIIDPAQHKSARIIRKYFLPLKDRPEIYNKQKTPLNHRILRYADVLLMYAEACNETGDDTEARKYLNKVRERVNLSDVTASGDALREAIHNERRLELAFEQCRLYDIRRWKGKNGGSYMGEIFGPNGSFVKYNTGDNADIYEKWNQIQASDKGANFREDRDLLFPIPIYEITHSNGVITQNPGW